MAGPLSGLRVLEFAGIGPGPFACMMLADHGAEVIRIERPASGAPQISPPETDILLRSRRRMFMDLKSEAARAVILDLVESADAVVEGFRPGVMERLGLGPEVLMARNPGLVYGRMTGWGQTGPWAQMAGHDINYIALSGALHAFGRAGAAPVPPVNMVGDFGGGAMMLAFGMVSALLAAQHSAQGTVVDAAMTDGSALLMSMVHTFLAQGSWRDARGVNLLDTGAHFYDVFETSDGKFIALGAIEPQFYARMLRGLGLDGDADFAAQHDPEAWPALKTRIAAVVRTRSRDAWDTEFAGSDACYAPVLSLTEAPEHPHNAARASFVSAGGVRQPAPAPRYSNHEITAPVMSDQSSDSAAILAGLGYDGDRIAQLAEDGSVG